MFSVQYLYILHLYSVFVSEKKRIKQPETRTVNCCD